MSSAMVSCPACQTALRLPGATPAGRLRCPKCKQVFAPVVDAEEFSESVAVVLDSKPTLAAPLSDPDNSFFEWLADAKDPLEKKPETLPPQAPEPPSAHKAERRASRANQATLYAKSDKMTLKLPYNKTICCANNM